MRKAALNDLHLYFTGRPRSTRPVEKCLVLLSNIALRVTHALSRLLRAVIFIGVQRRNRRRKCSYNLSTALERDVDFLQDPPSKLAGVEHKKEQWDALRASTESQVWASHLSVCRPVHVDERLRPATFALVLVPISTADDSSVS